MGSGRNGFMEIGLEVSFERWVDLMSLELQEKSISSRERSAGKLTGNSSLWRREVAIVR